MYDVRRKLSAKIRKTLMKIKRLAYILILCLISACSTAMPIEENPIL